MDFAIGAAAAMGASLFSNPFDVLKTRMQLQGELRARGQHAVYYRNVFHAAVVVGRNEGLRGLQKGLSAALVMHAVRNSVRLGAYQYCHTRGLITDPLTGRTILFNSLVASAASGAVGAFCGSPLFLIKTQMQSQAAKQIAVGHQHGHTGAWQALTGIYRRFGIIGLWRGVSGTIMRAIVGSSSQLTSFAKTKDILREYDFFRRNSSILVSLIGSIIGGIFQTVMITPFDLVSIRLYNQGVDANGKGLLYKGIVDCFVKIWRSEGFFGFYKGIGANYMRLAPHGAFCLIFWDLLKDLQQQHLL